MPDSDPYRSTFDDDSEPRFRRAHYAQRTSALAILSVISGLLSFPMMCCLFFSMPFSIFAIVCGHMSRSIVRSSGGEYSGMEMATFGTFMGYITLIIMGSMLAFGLVATDNNRPARPPVASVSPADPGEILLAQAESQLLRSPNSATGVSTTDGDAVALASHFIETLEVLDKTHFSETNRETPKEVRPYRVFAQMNEDSVAFLVSVPDLARFTPAARATLEERCWLIAQRSVDNILLVGKDLAVALYSESDRDTTMTGVTVRNGSADAGMKVKKATTKQLSGFFRLDSRKAHSDINAAPVDSQIDNNSADDVTLPAEVE